MPDKKHIQASDIQAISRIITDATVGITDVVEAMHLQFVQPPFLPQTPIQLIIGKITRFTYQNIRLISRLVGDGLSFTLRQIEPILTEKASTEERNAVISALNGVLGEYLTENQNPFSIPMHFRHQGKSLKLVKKEILAAFPNTNGKILLMLHGLCMNDEQWQRNGHDHGKQLAVELGLSPIYLRYNSGQHISTNGQQLAQLLEELLQAWPVEVTELHMLTHSMGGLLARSAFYYGEMRQHHWTQQLKKIIFLGTPHQGAPLERAGNYVDIILEAAPYTQPLSRLGKIRSAGITDLRYGYLLDEDWESTDRFAKGSEEKRHLPLPKGVACYAVAASTGKESGDISSLLLGDGLVYPDSAFGRHKNPAKQLAFSAENRAIVFECNHLDLLCHPPVYEQLRSWMAEEPLGFL